MLIIYNNKNRIMGCCSNRPQENRNTLHNKSATNKATIAKSMEP